MAVESITPSTQAPAGAPEGHDPHHREGPRPLFDPPIVRRAIIDSFIKLSPVTLWRNPVMFVVEVVSVLVTGLWIRDLIVAVEPAAFSFAIGAWLWFTVLFANFAEAMAEGRGKAQADTLRRTKSDTIAHRLRNYSLGNGAAAAVEDVAATVLRAGDFVVCTPGDIIPGDGEVVDGVASVDESAITGESAPVIREAGGDRSAVTGGTRVLSDRLVIRVTSNPGETFIDRMIALVEGAERQKTPNEIALNILLAGLTIIFLIAVVTMLPFSFYSVNATGKGTVVSPTVLIALLVCLIPTTIGGLLSAIGIAGMDRLIQYNS